MVITTFRVARRDEPQRTRWTIDDLERMRKPAAPEVAIGHSSRMDAINDQAISEAALHKAEEELQPLERMTRLVEEPGFGLIKRCGGPIPMQRLFLTPQSVFCVRCAG